MAQGILVFIEQRNGQVRKASLEALSEARRLCDKIGEPVVALLVGDNIKELAANVSRFKPNKILVCDNPSFTKYSTEGYADALAAAAKQADPRYVISAHTLMAKDVIPRVAARLDSPCVSDVAEIRQDGNSLVAVHPMYSGKVWGVYQFQSPLAFLTLRPNVFPLAEADAAHQAPVEELSVTPANVRAWVVETHASQGTKVELSEASVIVSGGRGIKGPENWPMLQDLCDVLGAALGASRAVVDAGWIDHQHQVGQTGKTVSPQLYIAVGVSGAIQHLAGMSSSKVIVAINNNPEAPIFKSATYGVVGDCFEIVPKFTQECKKLLSE
jgi:electron transfer flavoprotein alpha subunit